MVNPNRLLTPLPNHRKSRERLLSETYTNYHLIPRNTSNIYVTEDLNTSSSLGTDYPSHGDSYEFGVRNNSFSRTIDLSDSDTIRQQASATNFVHYTVQPGDTLQNLSVKYSCPVASIKRLNNIWSDQEFYGLTRIKLPAGRLRLIAEVINEETNKINPDTGAKSAEQPQTSWAHTSSGGSNDSSHLKYEKFSPIRGNLPSNLHYEDHQVTDISSEGSDFFFKNYDLNIERTRSAARSYDANAIMQSLAKSGNIVDDDNDEDDLNDINKIARREAQNLLNDMSDYGLSYNGLILFIFIVCLICPLAYVIYLEEVHHDSNKTP